MDSRNITVEDIQIIGFNGHSGIKLYSHASNNLIQNIEFRANFSHMLSLEGNSYGNVFRTIDYDFKNNPLKADLDFHGFADKTFAPPADNLVEPVTGFHKITGGGAPFNLPHTARGNTFWNVSFDGLNKGKNLFKYWIFDDKNYGERTKTDDYKYFPDYILIGVNSQQGPILIDGSSKDRNSDWIVIKDLNKSVLPLSFYQSQLDNRLLNRKESVF